MNEWIQKARAGDEEAFVRLITAHKQSLYKIARSCCRNETDAEDAVAQTVLDCWERLNTLKKPARFKAWLTAILVNNCNDILRNRSRFVVMEEMPEERTEDSHGDLYFEELMESLSERYRPVMQLYYGEGFKIREIAAILDIPAGTVSARLKRGREQLKAAVRGKEVMET